MWFLFVLFLINGSIVFSQNNPEARFVEINGTVETQEQGSSAWTAAAVGGLIAKNTVVSTGFKSTALVSLGNSNLIIRPLTRLTLEEIVRIENTEQVDLNLRSGRVRAEVTPPAGGKTNFTVRSPTATASVRGTIFDFDTLTLTVENGRVQYVGANGQTVYVDPKEWTYTDELENRVVPPFETASSFLTPTLPELNNTGSNTASPPAIPPLPGNNTSVGVEWP